MDGCSEYDKMLAGENYDSYVPQLVEGRFRAKKLCRRYNDTEGDPQDLGLEKLRAERAKILQELFGRPVDRIEIEPPFYCDYGTQITVGSCFYANHGAILLDCAEIIIGDRVFFGPRVQITTASHPTDPKLREQGLENAGKIVIGNDCWLGSNVVVCPNVRIGDGVTIGAGSVVTRDIPSYTLAVGVPARPVKSLKVVP